MYLLRVAALALATATALTAQQASTTAVATAAAMPAVAAPAGALTAKVHYTTDGDAWVESNKPAYVALFDVTRNRVTQLYPTFSAQATELSGTLRRFDLRVPASSPGVASLGASSLMPLNAPPVFSGVSDWSHTLLLVASTSPLRLGSSWTSNLVLNNDLVREQHWNDIDSDAGITAIINLVRPLDRSAEVTFDRVQAATPARYAASLAFDPNKVALAYSCFDGTRTFVSATPLLGASCVGLRNLPPTGAVAASIAALSAPGAGPAADTGKAQTSDSHKGTAGTGAASSKRSIDVQSISDPAEIRNFIETMKKQNGDLAPARHAADGASWSGRPADANRHSGDGSASMHGGGGPAVSAQHEHANGGTAAPVRSAPVQAPPRAASGPVTPPTPPATPIKP